MGTEKVGDERLAEMSAKRALQLERQQQYMKTGANATQLHVERNKIIRCHSTHGIGMSCGSLLRLVETKIS